MSIYRNNEKWEDKTVTILTDYSTLRDPERNVVPLH